MAVYENVIRVTNCLVIVNEDRWLPDYFKWWSLFTWLLYNKTVGYLVIINGGHDLKNLGKHWFARMTTYLKSPSEGRLATVKGWGMQINKPACRVTRCTK